MILLELFLGFLKVGLFSFGGAYGAIPLIRETVLSNGWLTEAAVADMIAVGESTPGPIMVNLATYVGSVRAGLPGAVIATGAVVLPAFGIILLVTAALDRLVRRPRVRVVMAALEACIAGIITATGLWMLLECLLPTRVAGLAPDGRACAAAAALTIVSLAAKRIRKKPLSPVCLILLGGVLGAALYA